MATTMRQMLAENDNNHNSNSASSTSQNSSSSNTNNNNPILPPPISPRTNWHVWYQPQREQQPVPQIAHRSHLSSSRCPCNHGKYFNSLSCDVF